MVSHRVDRHWSWSDRHWSYKPKGYIDADHIRHRVSRREAVYVDYRPVIGGVPCASALLFVRLTCERVDARDDLLVACGRAAGNISIVRTPCAWLHLATLGRMNTDHAAYSILLKVRERDTKKVCVCVRERERERTRKSARAREREIDVRVCEELTKNVCAREKTERIIAN